MFCAKMSSQHLSNQKPSSERHMCRTCIPLMPPLTSSAARSPWLVLDMMSLVGRMDE
jgi:hypothetical protein